MEGEPEPKRVRKSRFGDAPGAAAPTSGSTAEQIMAQAAALARAQVAGVAAAPLGMGFPGGFGAPIMDEQTRKTMTEIFVGNLPPSCAGPALMEFLNAAILEVKLNKSPGPPIVQERHTPGSKFAFMVFRTPEEATSALNVNGIPYLGAMLNVQRPSNYPGEKTSTVTWQQLTGSAAGPGAGGGGAAGAAATALILAAGGGFGDGADPATKPLRELFVGNVIEGTPGSDIHEFMSAVMTEVGLADASKSGNPILNVRTSGKFAFVEFRSVGECNNALNMDGIPFMNMELRIRRPEKYQGNPTPAVPWREFMELRSELEAAQPVGSTVVSVGRAVREGELAREDSYKAVVADLRAEASKYGTVVDVVVPRPLAAGANFNYSGGAVAADARGVGKGFVKYKTAAEAASALKELGQRLFEGQELDLDLYDEQRFNARDFHGQ